MPLELVMLALWALEDALTKNQLTITERDPLIRAVTDAVTKK